MYVQVFSCRGGEVVPAGAVEARTVAEVVRSIPGGTVILTGDARHKLAGAIPAGTGPDTPVLADAATARCSAATVVLTGAAMFARGEVADAGSLEPLYVKEVFLRSSH